jgi:hypothetical protein
MSRLRIGLVVALMAMAGVLAGCGSGRATPRAGQGASPRGAGVPSDAAELTVIRGWARALRRGDVRAAARYFALPSVFANGVASNGGLAAVVVHTERQAQAVNESLPCGALLISASRHGKYITASFRLTNRPGPGAGCGSGVGQSASTDFVIKQGRIVEWVRAPATAGAAPPQVPTVPANPQSPSLTV